MNPMSNIDKVKKAIKMIDQELYNLEMSLCCDIRTLKTKLEKLDVLLKWPDLISLEDLEQMQNITHDLEMIELESDYNDEIIENIEEQVQIINEYLEGVEDKLGKDEDK